MTQYNIINLVSIIHVPLIFGPKIFIQMKNKLWLSKLIWLKKIIKPCFADALKSELQ